MTTAKEARAVLDDTVHSDEYLHDLLRKMYAIAELEWTVFNQSNQQKHAK